MSWTDKVPDWLPPVGKPMRGPRQGRGLIVTGLLLLAGFFVFVVAMSAAGGRHTLYSLIPVLLGVTLLIAGLIRRNNALGPRDPDR
ncbi:hypothetical protein [Arthrobacter cupressi]|uniref:Uncharacterized protein n=1 Tax=Arthrobacter cupressi TaxID=1045773 RepID=A0A1G8KL05_9MICC|nr:hypothetical protein [Arthrobacter cupressi]NYD77179.1 hypothetical protein [Arthrobacter cupressi]SDI44052.1 hypothetical protein SAMN05216555_102287 [Arthrobacter cupressi]